jgi:hypothetical protein
VKRVILDLNHPTFQADWFGLSDSEAARVMDALRKLSKLTWNQLYADRGIRWEMIKSKTTPDGQRRYSLRIGQKMRAIGFRDGDMLRLESLHPDHDSAYN